MEVVLTAELQVVLWRYSQGARASVPSCLREACLCLPVCQSCLDAWLAPGRCVSPSWRPGRAPPATRVLRPAQSPSLPFPSRPSSLPLPSSTTWFINKAPTVSPTPPTSLLHHTRAVRPLPRLFKHIKFAWRFSPRDLFILSILLGSFASARQILLFSPREQQPFPSPDLISYQRDTLFVHLRRLTNGQDFIMSGKLDKPLDEIVSAQRRSAGRRRSLRPRAGRPATTAPVGGIQKTTKPARGAAAKAAPAKAAAISGESKVIVSNLPKDVSEQQIKCGSQEQPRPASAHQGVWSTPLQSRGDNLEAGVAFPGARAIIELAKPPFTIRASPATMGGASTAEYFVQAVGPIKRVDLVYGPNSQSRGIANVAFHKPDGASTAFQKLNGLLVDNRPIKIEIVVGASQADKVIPPVKSLAERTSQPKAQPKSAATGKQNANAGKAGAVGKAGANKKRRGKSARPAKKTTEELDSEMADYFQPGSNENANASASAPAAAATTDAAMEDEIMRCSVPRGNGETQRRYYIQGAHFVVRVILKSCSNPPTSSSGPETRQPFNSATRRFDGCRYRRRRGMTPRRPSFMVGRRQRRAGSKGGREKGSSAGQAVIQAPRCAARAASRAVYAPGCMMPGIVVGCANKAGRAGGGKASSGRGQRSAGRGFQANNGFVVFVSHTGTGGTMCARIDERGGRAGGSFGFVANGNTRTQYVRTCAPVSGGGEAPKAEETSELKPTPRSIIVFYCMDPIHRGGLQWCALLTYGSYMSCGGDELAACLCLCLSSPSRGALKEPLLDEDGGGAYIQSRDGGGRSGAKEDALTGERPGRSYCGDENRGGARGRTTGGMTTISMPSSLLSHFEKEGLGYTIRRDTVRTPSRREARLTNIAKCPRFRGSDGGGGGWTRRRRPASQPRTQLIGKGTWGPERERKGSRRDGHTKRHRRAPRKAPLSLRHDAGGGDTGSCCPRRWARRVVGAEGDDGWRAQSHPAYRQARGDGGEKAWGASECVTAPVPRGRAETDNAKDVGRVAPTRRHCPSVPS
ncbi:hypothetical protein Purlil1_591 [Purpureocillium lilacinum]|uniref:RRM domain-containing protein n=1 Tax=Purpureocillium lilacinum TaxID=33203 RepID=A0ABR0CFJ8_PURLI|nr:hypothetical protein Purlil1_591 [Purpureocillium lilacinum]